MTRYKIFAGYLYAAMSLLIAAIYIFAQNFWRDPEVERLVSFSFLLLVASLCAIHIGQRGALGQKASVLPRAIVLVPALIVMRPVISSPEFYLDAVAAIFLLIYVGLAVFLFLPFGEAGQAN